jgi:NitT/TauT family transport system substrate-binding protein
MQVTKFIAAGLIAAATFVSGALAQTPVKARHAWIVPGSNIASVLWLKQGVARHAGKSYAPEAIRYQGTPPMITALAVNEIDVGLLNFSSIGIGIQNAGMEDLRIFAGEFQDGVPGKYSNRYFVRKDSGITKVADLKGKVIAINAAGAAIDIAMRAMLKKSGLEANRDYTVVEAQFGAMKGLLKDKKADLVATGLPFSEDPELHEFANVLFTQGDGVGPTELGFWVARDSWLKQNKAAVVDMLEDSLLLTRWWLDPKNHDEAVKIVSDFSKIPAPALTSWLFTEKDYFRDLSLEPNVKGTQAALDYMVDLGFLKSKIDISKYVDLSYLNEARARVK